MKQHVQLLLAAGLLLGCPQAPLDPARAELSTSATAINFATIEVGHVATATLTLTNTGRADLALTSIALGHQTRPAFALTPLALPTTLRSQQELELTLTYTPDDEGAHGALLTIESDAPNLPLLMVSLAGHATAVMPDAGSQDSGTTDAGDPVDSGVQDAGTNDAGGLPCDPGAQELAFDSDRVGGQRDLYLMVPGCPARRLTSEPSNEKEPAFSPDGTQLAFVSDREGAVNQLFSLDLTDGGTRQLTYGGAGAEEPAWSPDGTELAYRSGAGVYRLLLDGGTTVEVAVGLDLYNAYKNPVYSRDGRHLIVDRGNELDAITLDGSARRYIVSNTTTTIVSGTVSPDGINVAAAIWCNGGTSIWMFPFAGTVNACSGNGLTEVAPAVTRNPSWGETLLAWETSAGAGEIMVGPPQANSPAANVTRHPASDRNPAWRPRP